MPNDGNARRHRLEHQKLELENSFGGGAFHDGLVRQRIEYIDQQLAELDRLRRELDTLDRSHKDLAHRLAEAGCDNERLRTALGEIQQRYENVQRNGLCGPDTVLAWRAAAEIATTALNDEQTL